jgi:hypothetical protein
MTHMGFDVNRFLNTTYTEAFDTKRPLMPEGDWRAYIKSIDVAPGNREDTCLFRLTLIFDDPDLAALPQFEGRESITMNTTIFVDIDKETGMIKYGGGLNWQLGQVRAAAGQNNPGQPWAPGMLEGRGPMLVKIDHSEIKKDLGNGKKEGTGEFRDNITKWAAI